MTCGGVSGFDQQMSYRLPPLNGLRAFEAAARHLSFTRAADELSVTPGAVSQQVKNLEEMLGVALFQRLHRGLVLTPSGETYLPEISDALERISAATDGVARSLKGRTLRLGVSPELASAPGELVGGLLRESDSDVSISVVSTDDVAQLLNGGIDALLRLGPGPYPGLHHEALQLHTVFAPHREAVLVVWPGLARCREFLQARALLAAELR